MRGACRALGVTQPVTSPTYTIGHRYEGRVTISHLDLYRFTGMSEADPHACEAPGPDADHQQVEVSGSQTCLA